MNAELIDYRLNSFNYFSAKLEVVANNGLGLVLGPSRPVCKFGVEKTLGLTFVLTQ